jgi:hypothetical protein
MAGVPPHVPEDSWAVLLGDQIKEFNMGSVDAAVANVQKQVPECVAVGLVDMSTGMLLSYKTVDNHPQEVLDMVAAATGDMFNGPNIRAIEDMFRKRRNDKSISPYVKEIVMFSTNLLHVFQRGKKEENRVLVTVCRASANIGMVLSKSRTLLEAVEAAG